MHKHILTVGLGLALLVSSVSAYADDPIPPPALTPEEVLLMQQVIDGQAPPTARRAADLYNLQNYRTQQFALQAQAALAAAQASSQAALHAAAPESSSSAGDTQEISATTDDQETVTISAQDLRILERIKRNQLLQSTAIHSGAPLAGTGPETTFALALALIGMAATLVWATWKEKKFRF